MCSREQQAATTARARVVQCRSSSQLKARVSIWTLRTSSPAAALLYSARSHTLRPKPFRHIILAVTTATAASLNGSPGHKLPDCPVGDLLCGCFTATIGPCPALRDWSASKALAFRAPDAKVACEWSTATMLSSCKVSRPTTTSCQVTIGLLTR